MGLSCVFSLILFLCFFFPGFSLGCQMVFLPIWSRARGPVQEHHAAVFQIAEPHVPGLEGRDRWIDGSLDGHQFYRVRIEVSAWVRGGGEFALMTSEEQGIFVWGSTKTDTQKENDWCHSSHGTNCGLDWLGAPKNYQ